MSYVKHRKMQSEFHIVNSHGRWWAIDHFYLNITEKLSWGVRSGIARQEIEIEIDVREGSLSGLLLLLILKNRVIKSRALSRHKFDLKGTRCLYTKYWNPWKNPWKGFCAARKKSISCNNLCALNDKVTWARKDQFFSKSF